MNDEKLSYLRTIANKIRINAVKAVYYANSGHPGGSLSIADMLAYLFFEEMNIDPGDPKKADRDRFVLSKGHCAPAYYSALALRGFFGVDELKGFRSVESRLQGHPDMKNIPGVDMSTGSLGQGISAACGMALGEKISGSSARVYAMLGDGETEEGQVWEAAMFAAHYKLDNLCVIVDLNGLQIDGPVTEVMNPTPHDAKYTAFGWNVLYADAHDFDSIEAAFKAARECSGKPSVIIAKSVKGKGISYMENNVNWHGAAPNDEQYKVAMDELAR